MLFLHLLYLALQFFNIGVPFWNLVLLFFVSIFQFFQLSASGKRNNIACYGCRCCGCCLLCLSVRISDLIFFSSCSASFFCSSLRCLTVSMRCSSAFCFSIIKLFCYKFSLPVTAFDYPRSIIWMSDARACICITSSSLSFWILPVIDNSLLSLFSCLIFLHKCKNIVLSHYFLWLHNTNILPLKLNKSN